MSSSHITFSQLCGYTVHQCLQSAIPTFLINHALVCCLKSLKQCLNSMDYVPKYAFCSTWYTLLNGCRGLDIFEWSNVPLGVPIEMELLINEIFK